MKGNGTYEVLPSFLLLGPSLLLPVAGYVSRVSSSRYQAYGKVGGKCNRFWGRFSGETQWLLYSSHGHAASQAPTAHKHEESFQLPTTVLWSWWGIKSSRFLLRGKEQAGIACLKPTTNISNVAKASFRAWNETYTSLPIYPSFLSSPSLSLIWKQDTSLWVTSRLISEKPLLRASGSWMRHRPCWSKPPASPTEASAEIKQGKTLLIKSPWQKLFHKGHLVDSKDFRPGLRLHHTDHSVHTRHDEEWWWAKLGEQVWAKGFSLGIF